MDASDELLHKADPAALLTLDGVISGLNAAMATVLGRPAEQCLGHDFGDLWPASQRISAESLVVHAARTKSVAMRVLEFPGRGGASVACLIEARSVKDPAGDEQLVWVHALDARNDLASLLIPFRMATTAADLGLWLYSPHAHQLEWLGGAPALAAAFPDPIASLSSVISAVHPDDREALRQLLSSASAQSSWVRLRYLSQHDGWHQLAIQTRRIQLGYDGPERIFGVVRDDTKQAKRKEKAQAALTAERQRAKEIAEFSSALITAATEQELRQVVLTRLAATFGATGALLALVDEGRLRVSTDAGIAMWGGATPCTACRWTIRARCPRRSAPASLTSSPTGRITSAVGHTRPNFRGSADSAPTTPSRSRILDAAVAVDHLDDVAVLVIRRRT
jgi:hypothetical protein